MRATFKSLMLALPFAVAPGCVAFAANPIGTAAVAKNSVRGTIGSTARNLSVGDSVFQNERIQTGAKSNAQILFRDETALTLNANSTVVLDKLVYDPNKRQGGMVLKAVSGSFRFISGSSPKKNYKIETPVGTIGIRGTIIQVKIKSLPQQNGANRTWVFLGVSEGGADLCNNSGACVFLPAGSYSVLAQGGKPQAASQFGSGACGSSGSFSAAGGRSYCTVFTDTHNPLQIFVPFPGGPGGPPNSAPVPNPAPTNSAPRPNQG